MNMFKLGADPEFFATRNNKIISAEGLIGGTKNDPIPMNKKGFFMQEDNVMVEFNIPPSESKQEFIDNIEHAKQYLETLLSLKGCGVSYTSSHEFKEEELQTENARLFGCSPDFNVYLSSSNPPISADGLFHRFAGGHIHVGFDYKNYRDQEALVLALDITLGLPSIFLDQDNLRRQYYGKAGTCRIKDYGIEYRTPSNFWLKDSDSIGWIYDKVTEAFAIKNNISLFNDQLPLVKEAIDNGDKILASEIIEKITKIKQTV